MQPDPQVQEPAAGAGQPAESAQPAAASPSGEPGADQQPSNDVVNDAFRARAGQPTSKPLDAAPVGESTAQADVKPTEPAPRGADGKFLPRRGAPEAVRTAEERVADLERQLAERDPVKLRDQVRAEILAESEAAQASDQERADIERYQRLLSTPDAELSGEDYQWREDRKELLAKYPHVEKHYQSFAQTQIDDGWKRIKSDIGQKMAVHASKPGVDADAFSKLDDWGEIGEHLYHAGARAMEGDLRPQLEAANARIQELEQQYRYSGTGGLGSARGAVPAGRSPSVPPPTVNDLFRRAASGRAN